MNLPVFLYGTLCDPDLFGIVAGTPLAGRKAVLHGHRVVWARGESFPLILTDAEGTAQGLLVEVDDATRARLDFYELGFHYSLRETQISCEGKELAALVYFPDPGIWETGEAWSLPDWQARHGALTREAAVEYMRLYGVLAPDVAARAFPQIRMRASSRLRARAAPSPNAFAPDMTGREPAVTATQQPYTDYFAVQEDHLSFATFGGGLSAEVKRASFMGGDAVTVLPYDPESETVLVVRQFRHGAFVRGDANPWTLEPAAGRIDPGETPEQTALRELSEETGLVPRELFKVAEYYPSPGAYSEFLISFVALADLSGIDALIGGLDDEAEDIMSHVVTFEALMELIATGAANTGPLVLSALWLARNRDRLRGQR